MGVFEMGRSRSRSYSRSRSRSRDQSRDRSKSRSRSNSRSRRSRSRDRDEPEDKRRSRDFFSIMVAALPDDITERELKKLFEKFGEIGDVFVPRFRDSNRGRGFAFVRFFEKPTGTNVSTNLNDIRSKWQVRL